MRVNSKTSFHRHNNYMAVEKLFYNASHTYAFNLTVIFPL